MKFSTDLISGRVKAGSIEIANIELFIKYLEKNASRIDNSIIFKIPILSGKKGIVFFEDGNNILIRYNAKKTLEFTSLCYYCASIDDLYKNNLLKGYFRFPWFIEMPKYVVLAFSIYWILYFFYIAILNKAEFIDFVIFMSGLIIMGIAYCLFGNVSMSFIARNAMKKINGFLAKYSQLR